MTAVVTAPVAVTSASITRPANVTAYATGQVVGTAATDILTFANAGRITGGGVGLTPSALSGEIRGINAVDDANVATKPVLELWLFEIAPAVQVDQAAFAPTDAEMLNLITVIALPTFFVGNAGAAAAGNSISTFLPVEPIPYRTDQTVAKVGNIYGVLVIRNAYVPISGEVFTVKIYINANQ